MTATELPASDRTDLADEHAAVTAAKVFVSYSRRDLPFVDRLEPALRERGIEPLVDRSEIYAFEDWWVRLQGLIAQADTILFVLSPDSPTSDVCRREVEFAMELNKRFAPVVARPVDPAQVPDALAKLNFVFLDSDDRFESGLGRLVEALQTDIGWIRQHSHYAALARDWTDKGRPSGRLLRSPHLEEAESWIAHRPGAAPVPTAGTQDLIVVSRQTATRRRNLVSTGLALGLVLALALASAAIWQRQVAVRAETEAVRQRDTAERNFDIARTTVRRVTADLAQGLRNVDGIRLSVLGSVLKRVEDAIGRLTDAAPGDRELQHDRAIMLDEFGTTYAVAGDGPAALKAYEASQAILRDLVERDPNNLLWMRNLSGSLNKIGDLKLRAGDTAGAMLAYGEALIIRRVLLEVDPANTGLLSDLSVILIKIGDVKLLAANAAGALADYDESLAILRALLVRDTDNAAWRRAVSVALDKIGNVRLRTGSTAGALTAYREALAIRRSLTQGDPDNSEAQRDLLISLSKVGDLDLRAGDRIGALATYQEYLAVTRTLAQRDPDNALWQHDVTIGLSKVGDLKLRAGDAAGAFAAFEEWLGIARLLVARDPANRGWQRDLSLCLLQIAELKSRDGDSAEARSAFEEGLAIQRTLVARDPSNKGWQRDLAISLNKIGTMKFKAGDVEGARAAYEEALAGRRLLGGRDSDSIPAQLDLVASLTNVADVTSDTARKRSLFADALRILTDLQKNGKLPSRHKDWPDEIRAELAKLV